MKKLIAKLRKVNFAKGAMWVVIALALAVAVFYVARGFDQSQFDVSFYELKSEKVSDNIRIVQLSDLHLKEFGKNNSRLLNEIQKLQPDLIAVTGDMTISDNPDHSVALELLKNLQEIAPTYYSFGNHEYSDILLNENSKLRGEIHDTGVNLVNNSYETVTIKNTELAIGGFCASPWTFYDNADKFMQKYVKAEEFKLLLTHHVDVFESVMEPYPVDLALTGHAHGGHAILPFIGGIYAPDQGLFPKLTQGLHTLCGSPVVINRGLGNSHLLPRFNNNPEIVVVDVNWY